MTWTTTSASTTVSPAAVSLRPSRSRSNAAALSDLTLWFRCCSLRYGDSRPGACHHHGRHRRASAQQPQPPALLAGERRRGGVLPDVPAHRQSGERGLQRHAVPQQLQPAAAQHQQPHPGLHHGLQLHGARGLHVHGLQRPALLPPTLQQPPGARLSAAGESQHRGAGAAVLPLRGLLPRPEGPRPSQLKTTQSHRFDQSEPRAGTQGQHLQQEEPGEPGGAALQTPHQLAGNGGFPGREVQDDGAGRRPGQPSVGDVSRPPSWDLTGLVRSVGERGGGGHWNIQSLHLCTVGTNNWPVRHKGVRPKRRHSDHADLFLRLHFLEKNPTD